MKWQKYGQMVFLTSRNALFWFLGVNCTASDAKVKFTRVLSMFPHNVGLVSPSLALHQANAVELANKVCFLLLDVDLTQRY